MIAKVICHAPTRREAAAKLARALQQTRLHGITNNRDFLIETLRCAEFIAGDTTTDFIERVDPPRAREPDAAQVRAAVIAAALTQQHDNRASTRVLRTLPSGWRNSVMPPQQIRLRHGKTEIATSYAAQRNGDFEFTIDGTQALARIDVAEPGRIELIVDGQRQGFRVASHGERIYVDGTQGTIELVRLPRFPEPGAAEFTGGLFAPMPGKVLATEVNVGDHVAEGQLLVILEAMKMEHRITAPVEGAITDLKVAVGDQVANGEMLVVLKPHENP